MLDFYFPLLDSYVAISADPRELLCYKNLFHLKYRIAFHIANCIKISIDNR